MLKNVSFYIIKIIQTILLCGCFPNASFSQQLKENNYYYELSILPSKTEIEFKINLSYKSDTTHIVQLPFDYYGTPHIDKWITKFMGIRGTQVMYSESSSKKVIPNMDGEVHLNYTIKYNPAELDKYSYAPNVGPNYFYMTGCQWMLPTNPIEHKSTYQIKMLSDIPGWTFYSSLSDNTENIVVESSFEDMIYAGFGGSDETQTKETFGVKGGKVSLYINGDYGFDKKGFIDSLKKIITSQNTFFNDDEQSFYHITILPRTGLLAGASVPNLFYCFVDTSKQAKDLYGLISHEYFHRWLPNEFYLETPEGEREFKREWFSEGFTEYFSRVVLLENSIIGQEHFVDLFNQDIINIANNPSANESYSTLVNRKPFGAAQKKLSYYRGALMALRWDSQLKAKGSSLKEMLLFLYENAKHTNGVLNDSDIYEFGKKYTLDFEEDINSYIIQGQKIDLPSNTFDGYQLTDEEIRLFYPGYDVIKSGREKIIQGVDPDGPAYKAGLRNGMEYVRRKNSNRWSNNWSSKDAFSVTVRIDGQEEQIDFFPYGEAKKVRLYKQ